jgi:anthranilate synthase component 1
MIIYPQFESFSGQFDFHRLVPVIGEALSDLLTPPMIYAALPQGSPKFLLESATGGDRWGRFSFVGSGVRFLFRGVLEEGLLIEEFHEGKSISSVRRSGDLLDAFSQAMSDLSAFIDDRIPVFSQGAVGYIGYDMVRTFESLPAYLSKSTDFPDLYFVIPEILIVFDHALQKIRILTWADRQKGNPERLYEESVTRICTFWESLFAARTLPKPHLPEAKTPFEVREVTDAETFKKSVEEAKEHIRAGDIFQVVLSRRFEFDWEGSPLTLYRVLRSINPSPYLYLIENGPMALVGSSPELFVKVSDRTVDLRPIAGTVRRSGDPEEDERRSRALLADPKERAEHVMLVDLGRNDVGRVSEKGGVRVREMMVLEQYSHVIHIVSHVTGKLADSKTGYDVIRAAHPAGTLSGAPKIRAMEIIEELEPVRRGPYAGCVGAISFKGDVDLAIAIRSVFLHGPRGFFQAGAGIVADSDPDRENQEVLAKAQVMIRALEISHGSEGPWLF